MKNVVFQDVVTLPRILDTSNAVGNEKISLDIMSGDLGGRSGDLGGRFVEPSCSGRIFWA